MLILKELIFINELSLHTNGFWQPHRPLGKNQVRCFTVLEAKKRALLNKELLEKIKGIVTNEEYERFIYLTSKVKYQELKEILDWIIKMRCVQKNCDEV